MKIRTLLVQLALLGALTTLAHAASLGSAFTYQGVLLEGGQPQNGSYDFRFALFDASTGGAQVGSSIDIPMPVTNGLFFATLDFGAGSFSGAARWLQILVKTNGGVSYTTLTPRQALSPTPHAIYALKAGDLQSGASPVITGTATFNPSSGPPFIVGNSNKVAGLNADWLDGYDSLDFVRRAGDTMIGSLNMANPATLNFGANVRQMINLWNTNYGIGVQADATYFRSFNDFAWFRGGTHNDAHFNSGGGETLMSLTTNGLTVYGQIRGDAFFASDSVSNHTTLSMISYGDNNIAVHGQTFLSVPPRPPFPGIYFQDTAQSIALHGQADRGTALRAVSENGVAVIGIQGTNDLSAQPATAIFGASVTPNGNGMVGQANIGTTAYGVWGRSTDGDGGHFSGGRYGVYAQSPISGYAGFFNGRAKISLDSDLSHPQLSLYEAQVNDFARFELQSSGKAQWHIAAGGANNDLNFWNATNGDVVTIRQDGTMLTKVLTITGGADLAEPFEMSASTPKGSVVIIDESHPGQLKLSERAYDTRVAGVVSGAKGINPGLTLRQEGALAAGQNVALTGRVYVQADATTGPIRPGDLLTTSDTPGHAMRVSDPARAQGAILGKAMSALPKGKGLVLVLVTLQ